MNSHIPFWCTCFPQCDWAPGDLTGQRDWGLQEIHHWRAGTKWDTDHAAELVTDGRSHLQKADQSEAGPARGSAGPLQHLPPHSEGDRAHPCQAHKGRWRTNSSLFVQKVFVSLSSYLLCNYFTHWLLHSFFAPVLHHSRKPAPTRLKWMIRGGSWRKRVLCVWSWRTRSWLTCSRSSPTTRLPSTPNGSPAR